MYTVENVYSAAREFANDAIKKSPDQNKWKNETLETLTELLKEYQKTDREESGYEDSVYQYITPKLFFDAFGDELRTRHS